MACNITRAFLSDRDGRSRAKGGTETTGMELGSDGNRNGISSKGSEPAVPTTVYHRLKVFGDSPRYRANTERKRGGGVSFRVEYPIECDGIRIDPKQIGEVSFRSRRDSRLVFSIGTSLFRFIGNTGLFYS